MALTPERIGQIAALAFQMKMEEDGIRLNPKEIKRQVSNTAKSLGIAADEAAEFAKIVVKAAYEKTMAALNAMTDQVEEKEQLPAGTH